MPKNSLKKFLPFFFFSLIIRKISVMQDDFGFDGLTRGAKNRLFTAKKREKEKKPIYQLSAPLFAVKIQSKL